MESHRYLLLQEALSSGFVKHCDRCKCDEGLAGVRVVLVTYICEKLAYAKRALPAVTVPGLRSP